MKSNRQARHILG
ncbi:TPA: hypothetical protein RNA07_004585, partial [Escherichia coli]|nr:hypothetical protein [Escherichia coli]HDW8664354.1 hypothetical protein [Escherichia coli]HDW8692451.1 hypothetical protein [Escherichia coli]